MLQKRMRILDIDRLNLKLKTDFSRRGLLLALVSVSISLWGCGGGGGGNGGGGATTTVLGRIINASTGVPPNPGASINIGGTTATQIADGTFTFAPPSNATAATITATGVKTLTLPISLDPAKSNDLGDIYLSDTGYDATVTGRVVTNISGTTQAIAGAVVTLAGQKTTSLADGTFSLTGLPVDLGNSLPPAQSNGQAGFFGKITATSFDTKLIVAENIPFPLKSGANPLGDFVISQTSTTTPLPPYTIKGVVTNGGTAASGVTVSLKSGALNLGSTMTDSTGTYYFWVVPGDYTMTATNGTGSSKTVAATLVLLDAPVTATTIAF